jgi:hypothetical protein
MIVMMMMMMRSNLAESLSGYEIREVKIVIVVKRYPERTFLFLSYSAFSIFVLVREHSLLCLLNSFLALLVFPVDVK